MIRLIMIMRMRRRARRTGGSWSKQPPWSGCISPLTSRAAWWASTAETPTSSTRSPDSLTTLCLQLPTGQALLVSCPPLQHFRSVCIRGCLSKTSVLQTVFDDQSAHCSQLTVGSIMSFPKGRVLIALNRSWYESATMHVNVFNIRLNDYQHQQNQHSCHV